MRSRRSSKPKLTLGRLSATEGGAIVCRLMELLGSNTDAILGEIFLVDVCAEPFGSRIVGFWRLGWVVGNEKAKMVHTCL